MAATATIARTSVRAIASAALLNECSRRPRPARNRRSPQPRGLRAVLSAQAGGPGDTAAITRRNRPTAARATPDFLTKADVRCWITIADPRDFAPVRAPEQGKHQDTARADV